ncbi:MAG: acyl-CoA thioesterase [Lachnospiraceae bacterium]|jgi:acyl-CoA hydrolase|nr:acyl-CoA thioesterase [Lachnospiraceae bacterium]
MDRKDKTVAESKVETFHIIMPSDMNDSGRLFGGTLMCWIDEVAGLVGRRHAQMNVTTGSVDNLRFLRGAYLQDMIVMCGKVTHVGNKSMEVKVETFIEQPDGRRDLINRAYLTMVGIDEDNQPARLPRLILETEEDKAEWERAETRRRIRRQQKADGFHFYDADH